MASELPIMRDAFMALPGTAFAAAAASAVREALSFMLRALISCLDSDKEVLSCLTLARRVSTSASLASSCFRRRSVSLDASLWVASSLLRLAMSLSAAVNDEDPFVSRQGPYGGGEPRNAAFYLWPSLLLAFLACQNSSLPLSLRFLAGLDI